jgi:hypothetical protein
MSRFITECGAIDLKTKLSRVHRFAIASERNRAASSVLCESGLKSCVRAQVTRF